MKKWDLWMKWNPAFTVETSPDHLVRCELSQVTGTTNTNITPTPLLSLSPRQDLPQLRWVCSAERMAVLNTFSLWYILSGVASGSGGSHMWSSRQFNVYYWAEPTHQSLMFSSLYTTGPLHCTVQCCTPEYPAPTSGCSIIIKGVRNEKKMGF